MTHGVKREGVGVGARVVAVKHPCFAFLLFCASVSAQQARPANQPSAKLDDQPAQAVEAEQTLLGSDNDAVMESWLNKVGKTGERLTALGVERKIVESTEPPLNTGDQPFIRWRTARVRDGRRVGVVFLPCHTGWDYSYLFALGRERRFWHVTDRVELDCHYDESVSFEITWIRDPRRDEILVHHACAGHGAGYLEQDLSGFAIVNGRLKEELETEEVLRMFPPGDLTHEIDRKSTFTVIPVRNSHVRAIEETRSGLSDTKWLVQRRIFRWNPNKGEYVPSAFTKVEASPN